MTQLEGIRGGEDRSTGDGLQCQREDPTLWFSSLPAELDLAKAYCRLIADRLVDELHLFVYPVALGAGLRLFPEGQPTVRLSLVGAEPYSNGVVHLTYGPA